MPRRFLANLNALPVPERHRKALRLALLIVFGWVAVNVGVGLGVGLSKHSLFWGLVATVVVNVVLMVGVIVTGAAAGVWPRP